MVAAPYVDDANVIGIKGHYDEVNRLCAEIAGKYNWAFVNVNMRPYYAEGSKSQGFEIMEQLERANARGTTIIVATHSRELLEHYRKRIINLKDGTLQATPPSPSALWSNLPSSRESIGS